MTERSISSRPEFPSGWASLALTPAEVSLANTLPVGQSFTWHRQPIPRRRFRSSSSSASSSASSSGSSASGQGFFVKQECNSDVEEEKLEQDIKPTLWATEEEDEEEGERGSSCEEEWSKAIDHEGHIRVILLRQTKEKIWFASVFPPPITDDPDSIKRFTPEVDRRYLFELFQLPDPSSQHTAPHPTYPTTPSLYTRFSLLDPHLFHLTSTRVGLPQGIRVLRQDPFETLIAFITSSANNVGRITGLMRRLGQGFGMEVLTLGAIGPEVDGADEGEVDGMELLALHTPVKQKPIQFPEVEEHTTYHLFPTPSVLLSDPELELTLRGLGFGYRANFISTTLDMMKEEHGVDGIVPFLDGLRAGRDTMRVGIAEGDDVNGGGMFGGEERWRAELLKFKGVGRKVADCIGLMCLDRPNVVPIDTHLQQIAARHPSFPARLKGKPTSGEKVYKEVQGFLTDLWGGGISEQSTESSSSTSSVQGDKPAKRSPRKKRKIHVETLEMSPNVFPVDTNAGMGMAGWAQAVMFAADLKGSKAVKVEKVEVLEEEMNVEPASGPDGPGGSNVSTIITKKVITRRKHVSTTPEELTPAIKVETDSLASTPIKPTATISRVEPSSGFALVSESANDFRFGGKSDLQAIRKNSAAHDVFNRLHSIDKDMTFVETVSKHWFGGKFPVVANQRCGSWYCDPKTSSSQYAYFKSTDGHTGVWDFSVRRANLQLASFASHAGGMIIVDSTRRGKRMPDALSKTIPIWCAVINLAMSRRRRDAPAESPEKDQPDGRLFMPAEIVSPTEHAQIQAKLDVWTENLLKSSLTLPTLEHPLRPYFVHPGMTRPPDLARDGSIPVICLSASRFIAHGGPNACTGRSGSFEYIQGSGDDHELWGEGLTPTAFHMHRSTVLGAERQDLSPLLLTLASEQALSARGHEGPLRSLDSATELFPGAGLWLGTVREEPPAFPENQLFVVTLSAAPRSGQSPCGPHELYYQVDAGRRSDPVLSTETMSEVVRHVVAAIQAGRPVLIRDDDGKDVSVGIAIACSWHLFDDARELRPAAMPVPAATKEGVRHRLSWILDKRQGANPARKTLQRVNGFLITPPRL